MCTVAVPVRVVVQRRTCITNEAPLITTKGAFFMVSDIRHFLLAVKQKITSGQFQVANFLAQGIIHSFSWNVKQKEMVNAQIHHYHRIILAGNNNCCRQSLAFATVHLKTGALLSRSLASNA